MSTSITSWSMGAWLPAPPPAAAADCCAAAVREDVRCPGCALRVCGAYPLERCWASAWAWTWAEWEGGTGGWFGSRDIPRLSLSRCIPPLPLLECKGAGGGPVSGMVATEEESAAPVWAGGSGSWNAAHWAQEQKLCPGNSSQSQKWVFNSNKGDTKNK